MSAKYGTTLVLLDIPSQLDDLQIEHVQRFLFLYLQHPLLNNDRQRKSVTFHPVDSPAEVEPSPIDWEKLVKTIKNVKGHIKSEENSGKCLLTSINKLLLYILSTGKSDFHLLIISPFDTQLNWQEMYKEGIKAADRSILSMTFIDTSVDFNDFHDINLVTIKSITTKANILPLDRGIEYISKYENMSLPNPEPVELFKGSMSIPLGNSDNEILADLNFKIQMYPLVKPKVLSNYVENKLLTSSERYPSKKINNYIEKRVDPNDLQKRMKVSVDESTISRGLKVGNSNFISDLNQFELIGTSKAFTIYGFIEESKIIPWYLKPDCVAIMQSKEKLMAKDIAIFTDLVQHLAQNKLVALARMVKKPEAPPKQVVLFPRGYVDELVETTGSINTLGFIMVECINSDDERIPSLPYLENIKIEEDVQKEMDSLIDKLDLIEGDDDLTFDELLMSFNEVHTPFDKYVNSLRPAKEELLIDGTFTKKWRDVVSVNEEQKVITTIMAFDVLKEYLDGERNNSDIIPSIWEMYYKNEEVNKKKIEETIKENWHISEPEFKKPKLESIDWSQFKFEKRQES